MTYIKSIMLTNIYITVFFVMPFGVAAAQNSAPAPFSGDTHSVDMTRDAIPARVNNDLYYTESYDEIDPFYDYQEDLYDDLDATYTIDKGKMDQPYILNGFDMDAVESRSKLSVETNVTGTN